MLLLHKVGGMSLLFSILWLLILGVFCHNGSSTWEHLPDTMNLEDINYEVNEIPQEGAVTMAFVFDVTGSMYDDLVQVIEGASRIVDTVLQRKDRLLHNYVLVPFHDPGVGPATVTTDHRVFLSHLKQLYVQGGGDCPEASIAAIKLALEVCLPNSFIYVFTDASSKDYYLLQDVLTLIQKKQSQVVFLMTGDCGDPFHPGYQAYERIASTSSGQVFFLEKSDVEEVLNFVRASLQARKVNLLAIDTDKGGEAVLPLTVDSQLKEFTVSLSGENSRVQLFNPIGSIADESSGLQELLNLSNVQIVNVKEPQSGLWSVKVDSNSSHTVRATGLSAVDFTFGFSTIPTEHMLETYHRPLKGAVTYLLMNITDLPDGAHVDTVDLVNLSGKVLANLQISRISSSQPDLYNATTPFVPPDEFFYLKISGFDDVGYPLERISPTAISSQLPDVPDVTLIPVKRVHQGNNVQLNCYVQSLVPFTVKWLKGLNHELQQQATFQQTSDVLLIIENVTPEHEDIYQCEALNIAGKNSARILLDVREHPPRLDELRNVTASQGMNVEIMCSTHSFAPFNVTWSRHKLGDVDGHFVTLHGASNPRVTDHINGTLTLSDVQLEDEGWYKCTAQNEGGSSHAQFFLAVQLPPRVQVTPKEVTITSRTKLTVTCETVGFPKPSIEWIKDGQLVIDSRSIHVVEGSLRLTDARHDDSGIYECHAQNAAGRASQTVIVKYIDVPIIMKDQNTFRVTLGTFVTLPCNIDARYPAVEIYWRKPQSDPNDTWKLFKNSSISRRDDKLLEEQNVDGESDSYQVLLDGGLRFKVAETDGGQYICVAQNEAGTDEHELTLIVLIPPSKPIIQSIEETIIALRGSHQRLSCLSSGYPSPQIIWFKNETPLSTVTKTTVHDDEEDVGILNLSDLKVNDAGSYVCVAENEVGKASSDKLQLIVYDPPTIKWSYQDHIDVIMNQDILLDCEISGFPIPTINWQKDGVSLNHTTHTIFSNGTLLLHAASTNSAGVYRCVASSVAGFDFKDVILSVLVPPSINPSALQMRPEALEGSTVVLTCPVNAMPPPTITWTMNNEVVTNDPNFKMEDGGKNLVITNVKYVNAGNYLCIAVNSAGETTFAVALDVIVPPTFELDDYEPVVNILEESVLNLQCSANGYPAPATSWTKDGVLISRHNELPEVNEAQLSIADVESSDAGSYGCQVKNKAGKAERHFSVNVLSPPKLRSSEYEIKDAYNGSEVHLECPVDGSPRPSIVWMKEDMPLESLPNINLTSDNQTLHFKHVSVTDVGEYICEATNKAGMIAKTISLSVLVAPTIDESSITKVQKTPRGTNLTLECMVFGIPMPTVSWRKDGFSIPTSLHRDPDHHIFITSPAVNIQSHPEIYLHTLALVNVNEQDGGRYNCTATSIAGMDSKDYVVEVMVSPYFDSTRVDTRKTEEIQAVIGSTVDFYCPILGHPNPTITWLKDDLPVGATGRYVIMEQNLLVNVGLNEAGNYSCVATNAAGSTRRDFLLDVLIPPSIQTPLSGRDVGIVKHHAVEGNELVLKCLVTGNPSPTVKWMKDGTSISPTNQLFKFEHRGQILIIPAVSADRDAGQYKCVATNNAGSAENIFPVVVQKTPRVQIPLANIELNHTIIFNGSKTINCPIDGDPTPDFIWMKNGVAVAMDTENVIISNDGKDLVIQKATFEESGQYTCHGINEVGIASLDFYVNVQTPPAIDHARANSSQKIVQHQTAKIECPVDGHPPPSITWLFNGHLIDEDESFKYEKHQHSLIIPEVEAEHAGQYTCIAANEAGSVEHNIKLTVQIPPGIEHGKTNDEEITILQHRQTVIYCPIVGSPPLSIMWFKNEQPLHLVGETDFFQSADGKRLQLRGLQARHSGIYKCAGFNEAGRTEKKFQLKVLIPPKILNSNNGIVATKMIAQAGTLVELLCEASGTPDPTIIWLKHGNVIPVNVTYNHLYDAPKSIENAEIRQDGRLLQISNLQSTDGGLYTCIASNIAGSVEKKFDLEIFVSPKIDEPNQQNREVILNHPVVLDCLAHGNPFPTITWSKNGEKINDIHYENNGQHLYIRHSSVKDEGLFICTAENLIGSAEKFFRILVQVPPKIRPSERNLVSTIGKNITLTCFADGHPEPSIIWLKDGTLLTDNSLLNITLKNNNQELEMHTVSVAVSGYFSCLASNKAGIDEEHYKIEVIAPPKMEPVSPEQSQLFLHVNQSHVLECPVSTDRILQIVWHKDSRLLNASSDPFLHVSSDNRSLHIVHARKKDAGLYECLASNVAGESRSGFSLDVIVPPSIESPLSDDRGRNYVLHHQTVDFECFVSGYPVPIIKWTKDGEELSDLDDANLSVSGRRRLLSGGQHLQIISAEQTDTGHYSCIASNSAGSTERDFNLMIQVPPEINRTVDSNYVVIQNQPANFLCSAKGIPIPVISWSHNGIVFNGYNRPNIKASRNELKIFKSRKTDEGQYTCTASNTAGKDEFIVTLHVYIPPVIDRSNFVGVISVTLNHALTLNCIASGNPPATIKWTKNGRSLDETVSDTRIQLLKEKTTLQILEVQQQDEGEYECFAFNEAGHDYMKQQVDVLIPPKSVLQNAVNAQHLQVLIGDPVNLTCPLEGDPLPHIFWLRDGQVFDPNDHYNFHAYEDLSTLKILKAQIVDSGRYTCVGSNVAGDIELDTDLEVLVPPTIQAIPDTDRLVLSEGSFAMLECLPHGVPVPQIMWHHNDIPINTSSENVKLSYATHKLRLESVTIKQSGNYSCVASSLVGKSEHIFHVLIVVPPVINATRLDQNVSVILRDNITLHCPVYGIPLPRINWYHESRLVTPSENVNISNDGTELTITNALLSNAGRYSCSASNVAGFAEADMRLSVWILPEIRKTNGEPEQVTVISGQSVLLECSVKLGVPFPSITWTKNEDLLYTSTKRTMVEKNGQALNITNVILQDEGSYSCLVENDAGIAEKEFLVDVIVPPGIKSQNDQEFYTVPSDHSLSIECPISGEPLPVITWLKNKLPLMSNEHIYFLKNNSIIHLSAASVSDAGDYTCVATNEAGVTEKEFIITVQVPPVIKNGGAVENISVIIHRALRLECPVVEGTPQPEIHWLKNGRKLNSSTSEGWWITGNVLQIHRILSSHEGIYICNAINVAGSAGKNFSVTIWQPPSLSNSSTHKNIYEIQGGNVSLECHVSGYPMPQVVWLKNNQHLSSDDELKVTREINDQELQIVESTLADSGTYQCIASNIAGNVTRTFNVEIMKPPTTNGALNSKENVIINQRANLRCEISGQPTPVVSWLHNGSVLTTVSSNHHIDDDTGTLSILVTRMADEGVYTCRAENDAGVATRNVSLNVLVPPVIADGPSTVVTFSGHDAVVPCTVKGRPFPNVTWFLDGNAMRYNTSIRMLSDGNLLIRNATPDYSGRYTCTAKNIAGTKSVPRLLQIHMEPILHSNLRTKYEAVRGQDVILECTGQGIPPPETIWEYNEIIIDHHHPHYVLLPNGNLKILNVQSSDMGSYVCAIRNVAGSDSKQMQLTVTVPPKIGPIVDTSDNNEIVAIRGSNIQLRCHAEGYPPPVIVWMKNGKMISNQPDLHLEDIVVDDSGTYICVATNNVGRDFEEVILEVHIPPTLTILPSDKQAVVGSKVEFKCEAEGRPVPNIVWLHNDTIIPEQTRQYEHSVIIISVIRLEDSGTYTCLAVNQAGEKRTTATLEILVPPKITKALGSHSVHRNGSLILQCDVDGDPFPHIIWTKDGHRILQNKTLIPTDRQLSLINVKASDSGLYKCIATNVAGIAEAGSLITVLEEPSVIVTPRDIVVELGSSVIVDCLAQGNPPPVVHWSRNEEEMKDDDVGTQSMILGNSSLYLLAVQTEEEGTYRCTAINELGRASGVAEIKVTVHGRWSAWSEWEPCSRTCGEGVEVRRRICNDPKPQNGGKVCPGSDQESRPCNVKYCPVNGGWSSWQKWDECSATCGEGSQTRTRHCDNPAPSFGGTHCVGKSSEAKVCHLKACPVDGAWGAWSPWEDCSASCGNGKRKRLRECNDPVPQHGGQQCIGSETDVVACHDVPCPVHGMWGSWSLWTSCSHSCGGGKKTRTRQCDSPAPASGGHNCTGQHTQSDYCNNEPCPVHGNWATWSAWGECSASCNGGQRRRFRTCNNPVPSDGGRACSGLSQDTEVCATHRCPEHGGWTAWNEWSSCSVTCGLGTRHRLRSCTEPLPRFGGKRCIGDDNQLTQCSEAPCYFSEIPLQGTGNILGIVNGIQIGLSEVTVNVTQSGAHTNFVSTINSIPPEAGNILSILVSMLSSFHWMLAHEVNHAVNGYSLTNGYFIMDTNVLFATGEMLTISHVSQGVDDRGNLLVDIVLSGDVPDIPSASLVQLDNYTERYVQAGPDILYAQSSRTFHIGGITMPYAWNHSIRYDDIKGVMPFLVEELRTSNISVQYNRSTEELQFNVSASITKGSPSNKCPEGFVLSMNGLVCHDIDECFHDSVCSHGCSNSPGSYSCFCPPGYSLGTNGHNCQDVDECHLSVDDCYEPEVCENTIGSFRCLAACKKGFRRAPSGLDCEDIDECVIQPEICDHKCMNVIGSYRCDCHRGYRLMGQSECLDIDECDQMETPCSHRCQNTPGSFMCGCPKGLFLKNGRQCIDYDECQSGDHTCTVDHECQNTLGSYQCIKKCPTGFVKNTNGNCHDIDECEEAKDLCHSSQLCENTHGSYRCNCPQGFKSNGPGQKCKDIDECAVEGQCQHDCENTVGSYFCYCPVGYTLDQNSRNCHDIDECGENVNCKANELCFNTKGSFHCIEISCPPLFTWDPTNKYCILPCDRSDIPCPPGVKYTESLAYRTVSLASSIQAAQDLIQLFAYNQDGRQMKHTVFTIVKDTGELPLFKIRQNGGKGVLYTVRSLKPGEKHEVKVRATSYDRMQVPVQYVTNFIVYISVSEYPY